MTATTALLDTSVWIPYLRTRRYHAHVEPWLYRGRAWVHGIALLELYAGARSTEDRRDVDQIRATARSLGRLYDPTGDDLCLAGTLLAEHARREGSLRPGDHSHDVLIAIGAARTRSLLLTTNARDMERWTAAVRRRTQRDVRIVVPSA